MTAGLSFFRFLSRPLELASVSRLALTAILIPAITLISPTSAYSQDNNAPNRISLDQQCASQLSPFCRNVGTFALGARGAYRSLDQNISGTLEVDTASAESRRALRAQAWDVNTAPSSSSDNRQKTMNSWLSAKKTEPGGRTVYMFGIEGTADRGDVSDDVNAFKKRISFDSSKKEIRECTESEQGCHTVHAGFVDHANQVLSDEEFMRQLGAASKDEKGQIVIVGHSLAGPVGTLIAAKIKSSPAGANANIEVVSFGAPPAFYGDSFQKEFKGKFDSYNVVNPDDPIANKFGRDGQTRFGEDFFTPSRGTLTHSMDGHSMDGYLKDGTRVQQSTESISNLDRLRDEISSSTQSIRDSLRSGAQQLTPTSTSTTAGSTVDRFKNEAKEASSEALHRSREAQAAAEAARASVSTESDSDSWTPSSSSRSRSTNEPTPQQSGYATNRPASPAPSQPYYGVAPSNRNSSAYSNNRPVTTHSSGSSGGSGRNREMVCTPGPCRD